MIILLKNRDLEFLFPKDLGNINAMVMAEVGKREKEWGMAGGISYVKSKNNGSIFFKLDSW